MKEENAEAECSTSKTPISTCSNEIESFSDHIFHPAPLNLHLLVNKTGANNLPITGNGFANHRPTRYEQVKSKRRERVQYKNYNVSSRM